jgi:hypothetical protein
MVAHADCVVPLTRGTRIPTAATLAGWVLDVRATVAARTGIVGTGEAQCVAAKKKLARYMSKVRKLFVMAAISFVTLLVIWS